MTSRRGFPITTIESNTMKIHKLSDGILRAITVREPWASLHCMGIKTCEIRPWPWQASAFPYPLTLAMHTSADDKTLAEDINTAVENYPEAWHAFENPDCEPCVPGQDFFYSQAVVGLVDVIGCMLIEKSWSLEKKQDKIAEAGFDPMYAEWAMAPYSFFLANPRRFKTGIQCAGQLKIWKLKPEVQAYIEGLTEDDYLPKRVNLNDAEPLFEIMPTIPKGVVKCLGKPNYSELDRKTKAKIAAKKKK